MLDGLIEGVIEVSFTDSYAVTLMNAAQNVLDAGGIERVQELSPAIDNLQESLDSLEVSPSDPEYVQFVGLYGNLEFAEIELKSAVESGDVRTITRLAGDIKFYAEEIAKLKAT